ncbi:hypothetical protein BJ684DRAFT_17446 [Piptocephalis cylindrospora]|uniref:Uncharacterized protein n=1 Tax=Piptocephalis cylindrospora TaxID=1907219 RepID=A0A4P9Y006_9FUNG|nr:hypothetical protein BJ684DRAFT_17446 [Piptocephalis cylindrospora]|eukprot:RKP12027.1 hypothetical protein BJ684DRAFT_17446 [Piptocephalis cylindrospora]
MPIHQRVGMKRRVWMDDRDDDEEDEIDTNPWQGKKARSSFSNSSDTTEPHFSPGSCPTSWSPPLASEHQGLRLVDMSTGEELTPLSEEDHASRPWSSSKKSPTTSSAMLHLPKYRIHLPPISGQHPSQSDPSFHTFSPNQGQMILYRPHPFPDPPLTSTSSIPSSTHSSFASIQELDEEEEKESSISPPPSTPTSIVAMDTSED